MSHTMQRKHYVDIFRATTGDRVRLSDTGLLAEVERDHTIYGDECKFGGGKVLRDGMRQAAGDSEAKARDVVLTNIHKADIVIKSGRIAGIGGVVERPDVPAGTIVEVSHIGSLLDHKPLRPARVVVVRAPGLK